MMSFAKNAGTMSNEAKFGLIEEAVKNGFISDGQAIEMQINRQKAPRQTRPGR